MNLSKEQIVIHWKSVKMLSFLWCPAQNLIWLWERI